MDVVLDFQANLIVQPDLRFVSLERSAIVSDRIYGASDLVVEVLSPHARIGRLDERVGWFAKYGVRECWLADLSHRQVAVLPLTATGVADRRLAGGAPAGPTRVLPGLELRPFDVFGLVARQKTRAF